MNSYSYTVESANNGTEGTDQKWQYVHSVSVKPICRSACRYLSRMPIFYWFWSMCRFLTDTRQMGLNMTKTSNFYYLACLREMPPRMLPGEQVVSYCKFYSWLETRWEDKKDGEGVVIKMHQNNFVRNLAIFRPHFSSFPIRRFF